MTAHLRFVSAREAAYHGPALIRLAHLRARLAEMAREEEAFEDGIYKRFREGFAAAIQDHPDWASWEQQDALTAVAAAAGAELETLAALRAESRALNDRINAVVASLPVEVAS